MRIENNDDGLSENFAQQGAGTDAYSTSSYSNSLEQHKQQKRGRGRPAGSKSNVDDDVLDMMMASLGKSRDTGSSKTQAFSGLDMSNLTGGQIQEVLDFLILNSLRPIVMASDVFNVQIIYLLSGTAQNRKRKLSALPREQFMSHMSRALVTSDREMRFDLISQAKIERSFLYNFVVKFLKLADSYKSIYNEFLRAGSKYDRQRFDDKLSVLEKSLSMTRDRMLPAINIAQDYLEMAYAFRNSIVENYIKMASKQARAFVRMKGDNFDFNDVRQNFLTAVTKAVDKYDSSSGALTSYINYWVMNAQGGSADHGHEYGIAFSIPQLQRKKLATGQQHDANFSVSLDALAHKDGNSDNLVIDLLQGDPSLEQSRMGDEEIHITRSLIKASDRKSLARLYLDIDETFSTEECQRMVNTMRQQGLPVPRHVLQFLNRQHGTSTERAVEARPRKSQAAPVKVASAPKLSAKKKIKAKRKTPRDTSGINPFLFGI